jgi:hypothetical protein
MTYWAPVSLIYKKENQLFDWPVIAKKNTWTSRLNQFTVKASWVLLINCGC